jgi:hypothetical protein
VKGKGLLVASIVLLLLAVGVYWSERSKKAEEGKPSPDAPPKLSTLADADVQRFEIRRKDAPPVVVEKSANGWKITAPVALRADTTAAAGVVSSITGLTWDRLVEEKGGDLAQFGLSQPALQVEIDAKGGKKQTLLVGDEAPTSGSFYAKLEGGPRVFTIGSPVKTSVDKSARDLRDQRLLTFNDEKLSRIELTAKNQTLELGKDAHGDWQILKPSSIRADGGAVEEVRRKLREAKIDATATEEDEKKAPAEFASGTRVAIARVTDPSGTQELEIRKQGDAYFAKSSAVEGAFKVAAETATGLDKGLEDLRNKKVFDFGFTELTKVQVNSYAFEKSGDTWKSGGKAMDSTTVQVLIDKLRDLAATAFPASGFGAPSVTISVTPSGGKGVEKVEIAPLPKGGYLARRENEPVLYQLDAKAVDDLLHAAADVKPAAPPAKEAPKK